MIRAFWHVHGNQPCQQIAFIGPLDLLDREAANPPRAILGAVGADGVLASVVAFGAMTCSSCGEPLSRTDLEPRPLPDVRRFVYIQPDRRHHERRAAERGSTDRRAWVRRPLDVDFTADGGTDVTVGQLAAGSGINREIIRQMCHAGEVDGAYRHPGRRREWRIPFVTAKTLLARWLGRSNVA